MTSHAELSEISSSEWLSLNQFLQELKKINIPCISVYYPYGKGQNTIQLLQETNRSELLKKIEIKIGKKILELKKNPVSVGNFTKTLCIFGWIKNGKTYAGTTAHESQIVELDEPFRGYKKWNRYSEKQIKSLRNFL